MPSQEILAVARELFARQGYHGTSVRDITDAAKVNVGAITYHFGSKLDLYHHVLRGFTEPLVARLMDAHDAGAAPLDRIERRVRAFFDHQREHPEMIPLMVREMTHADDLAPPIQDMLSAVLPRLVGDIVAGQKDKSIRAGDPMLLAISTMAQPVYINLARKGLIKAMGDDPLGPKAFQRVVDHCVDVVRTILAR